MRVLIAPDKFKGCLSAAAVAENIAAGIRAVLPEAEMVLAPVADGGEGTAEVICTALYGEWLACDAHDALGHEIRARYVWLRESATAVIEMSEAAGLEHLAGFTTDPLCANTFGVGEMMHHATEQGAREIIVGLGGSATTDGGFGMARSLGFRFFRGPENCRAGASRSDSSQRSARSSCEEVEYQHEQELVNGPAELVNLMRIVPSPQSSPARRGGRKAPGRGGKGLTRIIAAADVRSPLLGEGGAARMFAAQKGAKPEQIETLECALTRLAD
ncbi:MAG: glycerate kinase, partial [Chthoniobacterales bacterium]